MTPSAADDKTALHPMHMHVPQPLRNQRPPIKTLNRRHACMYLQLLQARGPIGRHFTRNKETRKRGNVRPRKDGLSRRNILSDACMVNASTAQCPLSLPLFTPPKDAGQQASECAYATHEWRYWPTAYSLPLLRPLLRGTGWLSAQTDPVGNAFARNCLLPKRQCAQPHLH